MWIDTTEVETEGSLSCYEIQNGGRPPWFPLLISGKGIGNELCDWLILLLALTIPNNQFTLDRKRRKQKLNRKKKETFWSLQFRFRLRFTLERTFFTLPTPTSLSISSPVRACAWEKLLAHRLPLHNSPRVDIARFKWRKRKTRKEPLVFYHG